jgi:polyphenol oxidase
LKQSVLSALTSVNWSPPGISSPLLSSRGINHGFIGTTHRDTIDRLQPHFVRQVHGVNLLQSCDATRFSGLNRPEADALWSNSSQRIAVKTADCLPVFIASESGRIVAAVHAGWRGLTSGIILNVLSQLKHASPKETWLIAIGPAISRESYEVGIEVVQALYNDDCGLTSELASLCVSKGKRDRWHVDLALAAALQCITHDIEPHNIDVMQTCTLKDQSSDGLLWNSYRRDGAGCPSNWSWIEARS